MTTLKVKTLNKIRVRKLITRAHEKMLWALSKNRYGEEETEHASPEQGREEKFDVLCKILKLNTYIVDDVTQRFLKDQERVRNSHKKIVGIDNYKQAGYLAFWISKLKPIMIVENAPKSFSISIDQIMHINEHLAIQVATGILYSKHNARPPLNIKILDDLIYKLRYRINTRHGLVLIFESLCRFFDYPDESEFNKAKN